jgi:micrococcal nuclease
MITLYSYKATVIRVIDGDTIEVMIDLGFNTWSSKTIRLNGINAPESRTRDVDTKKKGLASKDRLIEILQNNGNKLNIISRGIDKYGRCLADIFVDQFEESVQDILIKEGHGVDYHGEKR